jgi:hypothetical protein
MKLIPNIIKYAEILKNKPIKNKILTIGFLLIITKIPHNIAANERKFKKTEFKPLVKVSFKRYKLNIFV